MQTRTRLLPAALSAALAVVILPATSVSRAAAAGGAHNDDNSTAAGAPATPQQQAGALERGYRTGYSDGYQAGYRDSIERAERDYRNKEEYGRGDRAYIPAYGSPEDYRDGYRQGFEIGYDAGFDRRGFDSIVPPGLARRGAAGGRTNAGAQPVSGARGTSGSATDARVSDSGSRRGSDNTPRQIGTLDIPMDTNMRVELLTNLSTDATQRGDRFEARVIEPAEYEGAQVTGRVKNVRRAGKVRGTAELQLDFEQISLPDGRFTNFHAQVIEVIGRSTSDVSEVDEEGGVRGQNTTKDDVAKVGAGAGIGAIIGAIAGGGKGAAIGAVIGGSIGAGGAITSRGKDIRLERGQELMIRTATETRIQ
jgi:hypothetical protein